MHGFVELNQREICFVSGGISSREINNVFMDGGRIVGTVVGGLFAFLGGGPYSKGYDTSEKVILYVAVVLAAGNMGAGVAYIISVPVA